MQQDDGYDDLAAVVNFKRLDFNLLKEQVHQDEPSPPPHIDEGEEEEDLGPPTLPPTGPAPPAVGAMSGSGGVGRPPIKRTIKRMTKGIAKGIAAGAAHGVLGDEQPAVEPARGQPDKGTPAKSTPPARPLPIPTTSPSLPLPPTPPPHPHPSAGGCHHRAPGPPVPHLAAHAGVYSPRPYPNPNPSPSHALSSRSCKRVGLVGSQPQPTLPTLPL